MFLKRLAAILAALVIFAQFTACNSSEDIVSSSTPLYSNNGSEIYTDGDTSSRVQNTVSLPQDYDRHDFSSNISSVTSQNADNSRPSVNNNQQGSLGGNQNSADSESQGGKQPTVSCSHGDSDPYQNISKTDFYANYTAACCNLDASYRSKHGLLSGSLNVPGQYAQESANRPTVSGKFVRNTTALYVDGGNTYVVMDQNGREVMRVHKAGGYITLEEVAAFMYAFGGSAGTIPANYTSKKSGKPTSSIWGEYLRVNHSYFSGDTDKYPYEPVLPDISGCGGRLSYYEMDIGTTGTETPGYPAKPYIQGNKINRGAARLVYARQDLNGNGIFENNEIYVFYTHNHYNDFREYLNYYGGWGEMFGNITGGGTYSSETNAKPTPYVPTAYKNFVFQ